MTRPAPFMPIGPMARWRMVYDLLQPLGVGEVLTYEVAGETLDLHPVDQRSIIVSAVRQAGRELLLKDNRATEAVRNVGYRVIEPERHLLVAGLHGRKSRRALQRSTDHVEHVDWSALDPNTRMAFESQGRVNRFLLEAALRLDREQARMRKHIEAVTDKTDRTADEVDKLRARLRRLEAGGGGESPAAGE